MTATIKGMRPTEYKHIVALVALCFNLASSNAAVTSYIVRMVEKKQRLRSTSSHTSGNLRNQVHQEQVMQISMKMSGFTAGESDITRKQQR